MKKKEIAQSFYRGEERYNCAQAILKAFQADYEIPQETIEEFARFGSGRANEGRCGALFAGQSILQNERHSENLEREFSAVAGSSKCREIRQMKKLSCAECVALTADLLENACK